MILWKSCFSEMKRPLNLSSDLTPTPGSHRRWCLSVLLLVSSPRFLPLVKNYVKSFASNGNQGKEGNRTDNKRHSRHQSEQQERPIFSPTFPRSCMRRSCVLPFTRHPLNRRSTALPASYMIHLSCILRFAITASTTSWL